MDIGRLSKKPIMNRLRQEQGASLFTVMMLLILMSGLSVFYFQNATTEIQISAHSKNNVSEDMLLESGIQQVLAWYAHPAGAPDPGFFSVLECTDENPVVISTSLFVTNNMRLTFHESKHNNGFCKVGAKTENGKRLTVDLGKNPMPAITAGVQGAGPVEAPYPLRVHWGEMRYIGDLFLGASTQTIPIRKEGLAPDADPYGEALPRLDPFTTLRVSGQIVGPLLFPPGSEPPDIVQNDPNIHLDVVDLENLKRFVKRFGRYFIVSPTGYLEENGIEQGRFHELFSITEGEGEQPHPLVFIDILEGYSASTPLKIGTGAYKGYFYFAGDIEIEGGGAGQPVSAQSPPWPSETIWDIPIEGIHLDGFFWTEGRIVLNDRFWVYGAIYAGSGFQGNAVDRLEVWYNNQYRSGNYIGVIPVFPLPGTWQTM